MKYLIFGFSLEMFLQKPNEPAFHFYLWKKLDFSEGQNRIA